MSASQWIMVVTGGLILLVIALRLFAKPLRWAARAGLHSLIGLAGLLIWGWAGAPLGLSVGVSLTNALVVGLLGLPGFATLLFCSWLLR